VQDIKRRKPAQANAGRGAQFAGLARTDDDLHGIAIRQAVTENNARHRQVKRDHPVERDHHDWKSIRIRRHRRSGAGKSGHASKCERVNQ
jgi:hypothetical protein